MRISILTSILQTVEIKENISSGSSEKRVTILRDFLFGTFVLFQAEIVRPSAETLNKASV